MRRILIPLIGDSHKRYEDIEECVIVNNVLSEEELVSAEFYWDTCLEPLFHYSQIQLSQNRPDPHCWRNFLEASVKYARATAAQYKAGDIIVIDDCRLLLVPSFLREMITDCQIIFLFNVPFPSSEIFRCLPERKQILRSVLCSNLIGFETYAYCGHFTSSSMRILGVETNASGIEMEDRQVITKIFPTDFKEFPHEIEENIHRLFGSKRAIVSINKSHDLRGVIHALLSFELFLGLSESNRKVCMIQIVTVESLIDENMQSKINDVVARINREFGTVEHVPVHYFCNSISQSEYSTLLSLADIGIILTERDSMNAAPYDFISCQSNKRSPLVLSEFCGTAPSIGAATFVNPFDHLAVAKQIERILTWDPDQREETYTKLARSLQLATKNRVIPDAIRFLDNSNVELDRGASKFLNLNQVRQQYKAARNRLIILDYDGTLSPICLLPQHARPSEETVRMLRSLCNDEHNTVYIISGRDQSTLSEWLGEIRGLGFSAEHGAFTKHPNCNEWESTSQDQGLWKKEIQPLLEHFTDRTPGSFVETKKASVTWHYRLADKAFGSWQAKQLHNHLISTICAKLPLDVIMGKKNVEVRSSSSNKGNIVQGLCGSAAYDFIFCAGDDRTDEDMFKALKDKDACTCLIGPRSKNTFAQYSLPSPKLLLQALESFCA